MEAIQQVKQLVSEVVSETNQLKLEAETGKQLLSPQNAKQLQLLKKSDHKD